MKRFWLLPLACVAISGCSQIADVTSSCSGPDASAVTLDIVRDQVRKLVGQQDNSDFAISASKIRATVQQLKLSIEDIRTTKDDPDSSKKFCSGQLTLSVPASMLTDANETREMAGLSSISDMADTANVETNANVFSAEIEFNVQPTDDGEKIYAELESGDEALAFIAELLSSHLLKSTISDAKAANDRMAAEQQAAETAAFQEQWAASLEEATAENKLAIDSVNAIWQAISPDDRSRLLAVQRAWGRRKDASCRVEAASSASSENDIEIARLRCDSREQNSRARELRQYAEQAIEENYDMNDNM